MCVCPHVGALVLRDLQKANEKKETHLRRFIVLVTKKTTRNTTTKSTTNRATATQLNDKKSNSNTTERQTWNNMVLETVVNKIKSNETVYISRRTKLKNRRSLQFGVFITQTHFSRKKDSVPLQTFLLANSLVRFYSKTLRLLDTIRMDFGSLVSDVQLQKQFRCLL